ncbi:MAG TPA: Rieske 2Fe-2S domain-containing protein [Caulobacteraceae bacterium]|nr:Rieske 2Fe-2S domain-containing protein [Caulobacteraceae bacterium]
MRASDNELLTRVGPGAPMGEVMRRYWHPICTVAQVAHRDSKPVRSRLLGENFVVFRDTDGKVGVLEEYCLHRRVSLALGRVEKGGIRCLYHGWKFAADGTILETPNHCDPRFRARIKARAYPAVEAGGLVWTYIGPQEKQPPLPIWSFMELGPPENLVAVRLNTQANYLQLWEGGTDSSHVGILHSNVANPTWTSSDFTPSDIDYNPGALSVPDNAPAMDIRDTPFGYHYAAKRKAPPQADGAPRESIRVAPIFFPTGRIIPAPSYQFFVFETPQDDASTSTYIIVHGDKPIQREQIIQLLGLDDIRFWSEADCEFRASWDNGMHQDRAAMAENWTGFSGIEQEDAVLAVSMGPIVDRTKEVLVTADKPVVHLRNRLLENIRRAQKGEDPIGVGLEDCTQVRSLGDTLVTPDEDWEQIVPGNQPGGSAPASSRPSF